MAEFNTFPHLEKGVGYVWGGDGRRMGGDGRRMLR